ncbi:CDP-alcohol phosphatidyltransferase family protein [Salipiger sp.]|uniref:CDP-alcohol phosphatidyltransferase family protein n=1 Tax=Salipiger sp. TaxID=2078585 RepID=UPI003A9745CA
MPDPRRPLRSRNTRWAARASSRLTARGATPNGISIASMGFAGLGALAFWLSAGALPGARAAWLLLGAVMCQMRLLCNLLDGMVAVEGGRAAPDGPFWNEAPDRVSDVLLLAGAGMAAGLPALGWAVAALAVSTAYLRELGRAELGAADYRGPMAKPHRMAALTLGAVLAAVEALVAASAVVLPLALWIIAAGTGATILRRSARILNGMRSR